MNSQREEIFKTILLLLLNTTKTNIDITTVVHDISDTLEEFQISNPVTSLSTYMPIDAYAQRFIPNDVPSDFVPIQCQANGNCLFNAISILLCGDETMASELRVRTAVALIQLKDEFMNPSSSTIRQLIHEQSVLIAPLGRIEHTVDKHTIVDSEIQIVFETE